MEQKLAVALAIFAFLVVCIIGIIENIPADVVLLRAIISLVVFYFIGRICALVSVKLIKEWVAGLHTNQDENGKSKSLKDEVSENEVNVSEEVEK